MNIHAIGWGMTAFILVLGAVVTELQPLALLLSILLATLRSMNWQKASFIIFQ
jgi:hypothetical protein